MTGLFQRIEKNRMLDQTVCKPGSVPAPSVLGKDAGDGHSSGTSVAGRLARHTRTAAREHARGSGPTRRPYSVLLPAGLAMPPLSPRGRCALTAPFHPCRPARRPGSAVCFLWRFPWGRPRRALPGAAFPWSPDFPPRGPSPEAAIRPSGPPSG